MGKKRWINRDLPFFTGRPKVYVCLGGQFGLITRMFAEIGFIKANRPEDADLVVFAGGSDVSPEFYGQNPITECGAPDRRRDAAERAIFKLCQEKGIPTMGICRGSQFLHVMCGGELWQHVNNHTQTHNMLVIDENMEVPTSSTHHQMMQFNDKMRLIATCEQRQATFFKDGSKTVDADAHSAGHPIEVEVCSYDDQKVLCIQGHPEYGPAEFTSWSLRFLHSWLPKVSDTYKPTKETIN